MGREEIAASVMRAMNGREMTTPDIYKKMRKAGVSGTIGQWSRTVDRLIRNGYLMRMHSNPLSFGRIVKPTGKKPFARGDGLIEYRQSRRTLSCRKWENVLRSLGHPATMTFLAEACDVTREAARKGLDQAAAAGRVKVLPGNMWALPEWEVPDLSGVE